MQLLRKIIFFSAWDKDGFTHVNDLDTSLKDLIMKQLKKKTFYLDLELGYSSKDFENLKVKDLTSETNFQLRRGSTRSTTEPATLKEKELINKDQQHSDPDQIIQIKRISHAEA